MAKTRKPNNKKGRKSVAIKVKYKLGGRASIKSALSLKNEELLELAAKPTRKRDKPMLDRLIQKRGLNKINQ